VKVLDDLIYNRLYWKTPAAHAVPRTLKNPAVFIASFGSPKVFVCTDEGHIYTNYGGLRNLMSAVHPSLQDPDNSCALLQWLFEYLRRLEDRVFRYEPMDLSDPSLVFPNNGPLRISTFPYKTSAQETNGIVINPSPMFIPGKSSSSEAFFAYSIRMASTPALSVAAAQLSRRHWEIEVGDACEVVSGAGVIGLYPHFERGVSYAYPFAYQSCTNVAMGVPASMRGHFDFVGGSLNAPLVEFAVTVPNFELYAPAFLY
jgi:uncharacterized protein affecting Mg2+/Co2+ transport